MELIPGRPKVSEIQKISLDCPYFTESAWMTTTTMTMIIIIIETWRSNDELPSTGSKLCFLKNRAGLYLCACTNLA